nr:hypothetical protein [Pannonibacter sp. P2PFMT1]
MKSADLRCQQIESGTIDLAPLVRVSRKLIQKIADLTGLSSPAADRAGKIRASRAASRNRLTGRTGQRLSCPRAAAAPSG